MADAARREGEEGARERAARENQELRNQLEAARVEAEKLKIGSTASLSRTRTEGPGHADEQIRNNVLATRAESEENRKLRSDLEQHRMDKEPRDK
eukprot:6945366-Pyramimonas_sp.AAC.1